MRSKRMQPVAKHAEQKEQDAALEFVQAQKDLEDAEQQLQQLFSYREEYTKKLTQQSGMSMQRIRDHQLFVGNVGKTIDQAYLDIEDKKNICELKKQAWLKCRSRSHALNSVVEKYKLEEYKQQERWEQKEQDEHSQNIVNNKRKS
jgi:flagellar protein FliJ